MLIFGIMAQKYIKTTGISKTVFAKCLGVYNYKNDYYTISGCLNLHKKVPTYAYTASELYLNLKTKKINMKEPHEEVPRAKVPEGIQKKILFEYYFDMALNDKDVNSDFLFNLFILKEGECFEEFFIEVFSYAIPKSKDYLLKKLNDQIYKENGEYRYRVNKELVNSRLKKIELKFNGMKEHIDLNKVFSKMNNMNNSNYDINSNKKSSILDKNIILKPNMELANEVLHNLSMYFLSDFEDLEDYNKEKNSWEKVTKNFASGKDVDKILTYIFFSPDIKKINPCDLAFLKYFYARLLIKRGEVDRGIRELVNLNISISNKVSERTKSRLSILIDTRLAIEAREDVQNKINRIMVYKSKIENLNHVNDKYIANELDSVYGRALSTLFLDINYFSESKRNDLNKVFIEYDNLFSTKNFRQKNYNAVNTLAKWFCALWDVEHSRLNFDKLHELGEYGISQSKSLKDSIFFIESLLIKAIAFWAENKYILCIRIIITVGNIMRILNINFNHEGIFQLFCYLKSNIPFCSDLLKKSYIFKGELILHCNINEIPHQCSSKDFNKAVNGLQGLLDVLERDFKYTKSFYDLSTGIFDYEDCDF